MDSSHDDEQDEIPPSSSENTIENDEILDMKEEKDDSYQKSTFKNALQAKKRLQAFAQQKQLLISPSTKSRTTSISEKSPNEQSESHDIVFPTKPKKENPLDKAKATMEEIELLKKSEFGLLPVTNEEKKMMRFSSQSSDGDFIFRKRERKIRNYRRSDNARRSPSPLITTARTKHTDKPKNKYPRNWEEFTKDNWTFEKLASKESHFKNKNSHTSNDIFRQLLFDSPAEIIKPYHFKNDRGDDIKVPFKYLRYTLNKPKIAFNENMFKIKEPSLSRKQVLDRTCKENKAVLEKFYSRNTKKFKTSEPLGQRNWYIKNWRDCDSKIQETSIGLSFLQTYSDDDAEEEQVLPDPIAELNRTNLRNPEKKESKDETKYDTFSIENESIEFTQTVEKKMEKRESRKKKYNREFVSRNESKHEKNKMEENISWTPERKMLASDDIWQESPIMNERMTPEESKNKIKTDEHQDSEKIVNKIPSDDEWAETPERKSQETDKEKKGKKKTKQKSNSDSTAKKLKKKKKKLDKKKQREKEKKARKKEKLKAEKLKKEKKKEKEKEKKKEILKKLKKEFRQKIEEKKKKTPSLENLLEIPVKVKIEKEDKKAVTPVEDLRDFLNQREKDFPVNVEGVKQEKINDDKKRRKSLQKEERIEEIITDYKKIEESFKYNEKDEDTLRDIKKIEEIFKVQEKNEDMLRYTKKIEEIFKDHKIDEETLGDQENIEEMFKGHKEDEEPSINQKVEKQFEVNKKDEEKELISDLENKPSKVKTTKKNKKEEQEIFGRVTPDTEEYQSNWESDDGISPIVKLGSKKSSRGWESDEEVFERAFAKKENTDVPFRESPILEMPLDIKKFPRRNFSRPEKKRSRTRSPEYLDMDEEIKRLEVERINLSKQRMQLEMEKIRIHELEREKSMEEMARMPEEDSSSEWHKKQQNRDKWRTKDDSIDSTSRERREKQTHNSKNKDKVNESASTSMNSNKSRSGSILSIHSSPEITSTKSPKRTGLENAYQEFMRAVSGETETKDIVISSTDSEPQIVETTNRSKVRYSKSRRDRKRGRSVEQVEEKQEQQVLSTTDPKILQEILLPGEIPLPEIPIPLPVPVPSPKLDLSQNVLSTSGSSSIQAISVQSPAAGPQSAQESGDNQQYSSDNSTPMRPFSFSTLVISTKKPILLDRTKWKVDEDSDEEFAPKKKLDEVTTEQEVPEESFRDENKELSEEKVKTGEKKEASEKPEPKIEVKVAEKRDKDKKEEVDNRREQGKSVKRKNSRSKSPLDTSRDKRRRDDDTRRREDDTRRRENDTRRREDDSRRKEEEVRRREETKRRDEVKKRESGGRRAEEVSRREGDDAKRRDRNKRPSPPRHRETSPRRRRLPSPIHRRSSPRHRSPPRRNESSRKPERTDRRSPQRSSPGKRRRSYSPAKPSPAPRRRSPSHYDRISKSPRLSPMEGLKRSVADSTISDDLLPQPYPTESSNSPLCSSTPAPSSRRSRFNLSPKRPSLDERINQVLGIENQQPAQPVWKPPTNSQGDPRQIAAYPGYHHHNVTSDLGLVSAPPATSSKVLQVGNILQVVPSEDLCPPLPPPQPVQPPAVQKIVQVGNMLQIVPSDMEPIMPPQPPAVETVAVVEKSVMVTAIPERRSAEDVLAGRMAERDRKKQEKEDRKREKERKRKEKDKKKKMRLKVSTEEMIKRALELDGYIATDGEDLSSLVPEVINDTPGLDPSRSILSTSTSRFAESIVKTEKERKSVQFADGVRPGEGTSPSGGEELASPPPQSDVLVRPKKYKRSASVKKKKRKIKVKVIKKRHLPPPPATDSDEEFENLPPPSPPPGSPPPHVFPVRAKVHTINNIPQHYLPSYGITTAPQTPPVVQPQPRMSLAFQTPPTAMYRTPPPNVVGPHYSRMTHAPPMVMNVPPPPTPMHRDQQPYGSF